MANLIYNYFKKALLVGSINLGVSGTVGGTLAPVYIALVSNTYVPDADLHLYRSSLTDVVTPSNYSGSFALSSPGVISDTSLNQGILTGSNILLATVTFGTSVRAAVLFCSTPLGAASDPLIAYIDFTTDQAVTAGTFQIQWAAGGILALT